MIFRGQKYASQRNPLRQISNKNSENYDLENKTSFIDKKAQDQQFILNEGEQVRLKQLKNKYKKTNDKENLNQKKKKQEQTMIDCNFNKICIQKLNRPNFYQFISSEVKSQQILKYSKQSSYKSSKISSFYIQNFQRKIQEMDQRIEEDLQKVQQKILKLKQIQKRKQSQINSESIINEKYGKQNLLNGPQYLFSKKLERLNVQDQSKIAKEQQQDRLCKKRKQYLQNKNKQKSNSICLENQMEKQNKKEYAQQLKSVNFVDEMRKKIEMIQFEKKNNLSKHLTEFSENKFSRQALNQLNKQHTSNSVTLAKLTPNLAQSQIIEISQRQKSSDYENLNAYKKTSSSESFVIKNFKFKDQKTSRLKESSLKEQFYDRIVEQKQEQSLAVSPCLQKSNIYNQVQRNLQQTQLIETHSLQGEFQIEQEFQKQFVLLINRMAYQAQIDNKFASQIYKYQFIYTSKGPLKALVMQRLKQISKEKDQHMKQGLLQISQMQIDPLVSVQKSYQEFSQDQITKLSIKLKAEFTKIQNYYKKKLFKNYSLRTIKFFIQELEKCHKLRQNQDLNIGHLTSYINMRTGKNLRNRYFYRFIKRIEEGQKKIMQSILKKQNIFQALVDKS